MADTDDSKITGLLGRDFKRSLAAGNLNLCMTVRYSRTIEIAQVTRLAGYDALYCDLEHSALTIDQVSQISMAAAMSGIVPLVRVPCHGHHYISRVLDGGAHGVVVPHVDTVDEAKACVDACRYPPMGGRSLTGLGPLAGQSVGTTDAYRLINENTVLIVMLESPEAIKNADAIAAVEGVDMLLIGTNDLGMEMGIPGQLDSDQVRDAYQTTADACKKHGKALGIGGIKEGPMLDAIYAMGGRFIMGRVDGVLMSMAATTEVKTLRKLGS